MEYLGDFDYFLGLCITDGPFSAFLELSIISLKQGRK